MAGAWRRALLLLGLGPDDDYDDYEPAPEPPRPVAGAPRVARPYQPKPEEPTTTGVRTIPARNVTTRERDQTGVAHAPRLPSRDQSTEDLSAITIRPKAPAQPAGSQPNLIGGGAVRTVPSSPSAAKPQVVTPQTFDHAKEVGDRFRSGQPVIMNLQDADRDLRRRLVDFASGLCYALTGDMERVATHVYLLTPANVHVSDEERDRLRHLENE